MLSVVKSLEYADYSGATLCAVNPNPRGRMRTDKDPKTTTERLTNSLRFIATSSGSARERYSGAWASLLPLLESDFPLIEDKAMIAKIHASVPDKVPDGELGDRLNDIWELYWRMSSNEQYR